MKLAATVYDNANAVISGAPLSWSTNNSAVATVSATGLITAVMNGTATITARSGSASASITVTVMQTAGSIAIEPMTPPALMALEDTVQLTATVLDQNGQPVTGAVVTWTSSDEAVATVNNQGLVTAVMNGTAMITARSGTASTSITVTVMQTAGSIAIEPMTPPALMALEDTVQLTATVLDQNGQPVTGAVVTWTSSDEAVATVNNQGLVTAVMNGTAMITARSGTASTSITVTVMQTAGSIAIEPMTPPALMALEDTVQLTATVLDQNGQPVTGAVVTWTSSDEAVATVNNQGLVTAVMNGTAMITARSGTASTSITVTVMQTAGTITIEPMTATLMALGETVQLAATVLDQNGQPVTGAVVTWTSSDEAVATVTVATVSATGLVTAVMNGTATITARSGTASTSITVTVMQTAGTITIEPMTASTLMALGEIVQLAATVLDQNSQPVADAVVTWWSGQQR